MDADILLLSGATPKLKWVFPIMVWTFAWLTCMLDFKIAIPEIAASTLSFLVVNISFTGTISAATIASTITGILYPEPVLLIILT